MAQLNAVGMFSMVRKRPITKESMKLIPLYYIFHLLKCDFNTFQRNMEVKLHYTAN
uniref:Uncharacterized protein n=1 Tax=Anguilla anguilla TaxID=7936 RepID=A0A0E9XPH7_ANGAN